MALLWTDAIYQNDFNGLFFHFLSGDFQKEACITNIESLKSIYGLYL